MLIYWRVYYTYILYFDTAIPSPNGERHLPSCQGQPGSCFCIDCSQRPYSPGVRENRDQKHLCAFSLAEPGLNMFKVFKQLSLRTMIVNL